ncbi:hypothetical protein DM01DRAFT_1335446 [Hesseltinella vesiculosa]|uniref:Uncharacterized protein n=1 Tax=Hesseltinella vesiculosa TaxID=101127 RepID=A0A1X2GJF6_9FUNG|nr:hypothetical protein DM01DRAFT_1335446 [Hesseltinella vesiculosa]
MAVELRVQALDFLEGQISFLLIARVIKVANTATVIIHVRVIITQANFSIGLISKRESKRE